MSVLDVLKFQTTLDPAPFPERTAAFVGKTVYFCGTLVESKETLTTLVETHGGSVTTEPTSKCDVFLSSHATSDVWTNEYKLGFSPDLKRVLALALAYDIPVVDAVPFLSKCIRKNAFCVPDAADVLASVQEARAAHVENKNGVPEPPSALPARVKIVADMIFSDQVLSRTLADLGVDRQRLVGFGGGRLREAYTILSDLEKELNGQSCSPSEVKRLSDNYYTCIPHINTPPIDSIAKLLSCVEVLEALGHIDAGGALNPAAADAQADTQDEQLAAFAMPQLINADADALRGSTNTLDISFRRLGVTMTPVSRGSAAFDMIERYAANTFAASHALSFSAQVVDVLELERAGEREAFEAVRTSLGNVHLLWHGSRLANFSGILSQGLRIAPPEAPTSGHFLGKGLYFADVFSKSVEYCHASTEQPEALMLLCEVAMGNVYNTAHGKFVEDWMLKDGKFDSVLGMGLREPAAAYASTHENVRVPLGTEGPSPIAHSELEHNEYVVYDTRQVYMRYLVRVRYTSVK